MALVAEAGRATPLVQLRQRELARAIGQFAADDVKSNRRRLGLRVDSDQARMPDALRLSLFLLVILMVAIAVAVFAKLIGVLDRKSVVAGKSVSGSVDLGGRRIIKKKI